MCRRPQLARTTSPLEKTVTVTWAKLLVEKLQLFSLLEKGRA